MMMMPGDGQRCHKEEVYQIRRRRVRAGYGGSEDWQPSARHAPRREAAPPRGRTCVALRRHCYPAVVKNPARTIRLLCAVCLLCAAFYTFSSAMASAWAGSFPGPHADAYRQRADHYFNASLISFTACGVLALWGRLASLARRLCRPSR